MPSRKTPSTNAGQWLQHRATGLSLFQKGRFQEAIAQLSDTKRLNKVLSRRDHLSRIECYRRSGRLDEARGEWSALADQVLNDKDDLLCGPLLDLSQTLDNLAETPVDRGRVISLAERAESVGDIARSWRAYQDIWSDPRLSDVPEKVAARNSVIRRAGLGILRIISGGTGTGDPFPKLTRWMELLEKEPETSGR
ncbi:MAG: hypothetical protein ACYTG7_25695, partial [Planctomycetota bacterium]